MSNGTTTELTFTELLEQFKKSKPRMVPEVSTLERLQRQRYAKPLSQPIDQIPGYAYLAVGDGYHKIGNSVRPLRRSAALSGGLPFQMELIHAVKVRDKFKAEEFLHSYFAQYRIRGEWFHLPATEIEFFRDLTTARLEAMVSQWDGK